MIRENQNSQILSIYSYIFGLFCIIYKLSDSIFLFKGERTLDFFSSKNIFKFINKQNIKLILNLILHLFVQDYLSLIDFQLYLIFIMNQKLTLLLFFIIIATSKRVNTTDFWKQKLKDSEVDFQSFAGYEEVDWYRLNGTSGIYYQLFGAKRFDLNESNSKVPLFLWLQGGPGASSLFGAYTQVGPIQISQSIPKLRQYSWNLLGHLLFVDQPLNVGFSFDENRQSNEQVNSTVQACNHLLNFIYNFYQTWPSLQAAPLYIIGQSFGGRYAVEITNLINSNLTFQQKIKISIKGVIISSGWIDPANQMNFYDSLLYSAGIVSNKFRDICSSLQTIGIVDIYKNQYKNASEYFDYLTKNSDFSNNYWGGMSFLNFRSYENGDYSMDKYVQKYKKQLGVEDFVNYIPKNDKVYHSFKLQLVKSSIKQLTKTINNGIRVLIYNGQNDYTVNTAGVLNYLNSIVSPRMNLWKSSKKNVWRVYSQIRGWSKVTNNIWFFLVNNAGHKITTDQPQSCFSLLGRFIYNDQDW